MVNYMLSGNITIISLIAGLIKKKVSLYKINYHPELDSHIRNKIKSWMRVNYTIIFPKKNDLSGLKTDVDK